MKSGTFIATLFAASAILAVEGNLQAAPDERQGTPIRVLFIGNSYTYYNNLPEMVATLSGGRIETRMVAHGGYTLQQHWDSGEAVSAIREGKWDWVVLQEQSLLGGMRIDGIEQVNEPDFFFANVRMFDAEIRKARAKTMLYMTWARRAAPEQQAFLTWSYTSIAHELNVPVAAVGVAWQKVRETEPAIILHTNDGSHPSAAGSYLAACVFVQALLGSRAPSVLPARVTGHPIGTNERPDMGRTLDLANLPGDRAEVLHKAASEAADFAAPLPAPGPRPSYPVRASLPPAKKPFTAAEVSGAWRGTLRFFAIPVQAELVVNADNAGRCTATWSIWTPNNDRRLRSPVTSCRVTEVGVAFLMPDYRGNGPSESYWSHYTGDTLTGWADYRGIARSIRLLGSFELRRYRPAQQHQTQ